MKPEFNILLVFANGTPTGPDRQSAVDNVRNFYSPAVKLNFHTKDLDVGYPVWDAPVTIALNQGGYGTARFLNEAWYDGKVTAYALKLGKARLVPYHGVVLILSASHWKGLKQQGLFGDYTQGIAQLYLNGSPMTNSNLYTNLQHEMSHFLSKFLGVNIDTHQFIEDQNSGLISPSILPHLKPTGFFVWFRGVQETARFKWRAFWGI